MLTFRPAIDSDVPELEALVTAAFEVYVPRIGRRPAPMTADYPALVSAEQVWVAVQDGAILGLLVLVPAVDHLYLDTIAVHPDAQGSGVGRRLMDLAETEARRHDLPAVVLCTNETMVENLAYYPRRGYEQSHRIEQDGFHRVFFRKSLA